MAEKYYLKLYDTPLMSFYLSNNEVGELTVSGIVCLTEEQHLLPIGLSPTDDGVAKWLRSRVIPKNREFVHEILSALKLTIDDTKGIIDICMGLSLNDSYWIVKDDTDIYFSEYNLYENPFSKALGLIAYTGYGASELKFSTSPELTTDGALPKAWRFLPGDGIYLYKGGMTGFSNSGNEPYCEFYASQIAEKMNINAIKYDLVKWKGILASKCSLFTDLDTSFVPFAKLAKSSSLSDMVSDYDSRGKLFSDHIRDMLIFDALIYNTDRHFNNFGFLRDNHSGEIIAPAPIFDNGMSLFNLIPLSRIDDMDEYAKTRPPAYDGVSFERIVQIFGTAAQSEKLRKMINFKFTRHNCYNLPAKRLHALEKHLQKRVVNLINLIKN